MVIERPRKSDCIIVNGLHEAINRSALKKLDNELSNLETQRSRLHDLLDTDTFLTRSKELADRISGYQAERDLLKKELELEK